MSQWISHLILFVLIIFSVKWEDWTSYPFSIVILYDSTIFCHLTATMLSMLNLGIWGSSWSTPTNHSRYDPILLCTPHTHCFLNTSHTSILLFCSRCPLCCKVACFTNPYLWLIIIFPICPFLDKYIDTKIKHLLCLLSLRDLNVLTHLTLKISLWDTCYHYYPHATKEQT